MSQLQTPPERRTATVRDIEQLQDCLAQRIGEHRLEMWFARTRFDASGRTLCVITDSQFVARWIEKHFRDDLRVAAEQAMGQCMDIAIRVEPASKQAIEAPFASDAPPVYPFPGTTAQSSPRPNGKVNRRVSLRRLDDFVVGASNKLAYSAACTLIDDPNPKLISPLFIHGECGVGKTHLLQGVCHRFSDRHGAAAVRYVTGEQFTNEYIASVRNHTIDAFRNRVRKLDLLAIDDVQFLSNKAKTQSEFLYTLDAIEHTGARIVVASNEHPRQIRKFTPSLVSRLLSGMVVQVDPPDQEMRMKLVHKLAADRNMSINESAVAMIAGRCIGSVRELEGAVTKVAALKAVAELRSDAGERGEVGLLLVEQLFKDHGWRQATPVRISSIIEAVCSRLGVTRGDLLSTGRHRRVVLARALVAHLGREMTTLSYPEIAQALGRRHHSTVHTAAQRLGRQIAEGETVIVGSGDALPLLDVVDQLRRDISRR